MTDDNTQAENRGEDGRFLKENRFWEARASHGRPPIYNDPEHLWNDCCAYFEWTIRNPLWEEKVFAHQGEITKADVARMRAMTLAAMCNFLGIDHTTWRAWRSERSDLSPIIERVENVIWTQKFEGAAAGLLNANLISRELGLADRKEHTGPDGEPLKPSALTDVEIARRLAFLLESGARKLTDQSNQTENEV
ncbi:terminase small subunit [Roseovarius sp. B08]|uniref:terminase small subunit n=1 Tax=Roseovarius sp. B08 TaxID=3449223 RepID=UPI003EDC5764